MKDRTEYADLELSLHRAQGAAAEGQPATAAAYAVELRFTQPGSDADIRTAGPGSGGPALAFFDAAALHNLAQDPPAYGKALSNGLFASESVRGAYLQARTSAASLDAPLRLRLLIGPSASELHALHWELLTDPQDDALLAASEQVLFSRYLASLDWRPVRLRTRGSLAALALAANPSGLDEYDLQPVDAAAEIERIRKGLGDIPLRSVSPATVDGLAAGLRDGADVLCIVAHGSFKDGETWLWLEDANGKLARLAGSQLAARLKDLEQRPQLALLVACQSAAAGAGGVLAALGPRLAEAGIPAVIAMQGNISTETIAGLLPVFFTELQRDGQIDRALAVARRAVSARADAWMPALYLRLRSGRLWYTPGFGDERTGFKKWPALLGSIRNAKCTPIVGPGLVEPLLGSQRDIARRWAETYHYPMAPHERESLPQVAQYLAVNQSQAFPYDALAEYLQAQLQQRFGGELGDAGQSGSLDSLVDAVGALQRQRRPQEAHRALAQLPLPLFITTNTDNLLAAALKEAGKEPEVALCPWNEDVEQIESIFDREEGYFPTTKRPLVYHLFGRLDQPGSMVLTEDDIFDYLIGVTSNKELIPGAVRRALSDTALLFLGFQMDDWNFRVLFRSVLAQQGGTRRIKYAHIAAQVEPEEGRILEPQSARSYLEDYFDQGADISIFWGSAEDFLGELTKRWQAEAQPAAGGTR